MRKKFALTLALCLALTSCATVADYATPTPPLGQEATPTPGPDAPGQTLPPQEAPAAAPVWGEQVYMTAFSVTDRPEPVFAPEYRLPKIENADGIPAYEAINAYYTDILDQLAASAAGLSGYAVEDFNIAQSLGETFYPYVDSESYVLSLTSSTRASVLRTHISNQGGPYPVNYPLADTFDLRTGARLTFADLFTCDADAAAQRVLDAVLTRNAAGGYAGQVLDEAILREGYDREQFYLTEDSLVVYFPQGTLPTALGNPTFAVHYTELEDIFAPWQ